MSSIPTSNIVLPSFKELVTSIPEAHHEQYVRQYYGGYLGLHFQVPGQLSPVSPSTSLPPLQYPTPRSSASRTYTSEKRSDYIAVEAALSQSPFNIPTPPPSACNSSRSSLSSISGDSVASLRQSLHNNDVAAATAANAASVTPTPLPINSQPKRKHVCKTCTRVFTTSGHLARHKRIHTGERKHVCPWPSCEAKFARQDNCMQHYKTHTNGKCKRRK